MSVGNLSICARIGVWLMTSCWERKIRQVIAKRKEENSVFYVNSDWNRLVDSIFKSCEFQGTWNPDAKRAAVARVLDREIVQLPVRSGSPALEAAHERFMRSTPRRSPEPIGLESTGQYATFSNGSVLEFQIPPYVEITGRLKKKIAQLREAFQNAPNSETRGSLLRGFGREYPTITVTESCSY